ncbi:MAG TPA: class I SAM-dependent rRNA methyltransferase [Candidatus Binataceae bacterium]|nr:class I SAM-dependent rRNA methyltransferase [Candidatus Binataceae bacterium]
MARRMTASDAPAPDTAQARARASLKRGRDGPVRGGNPWIFSNALARIEPKDAAAGDPIDVIDASGDLIAYGYYNPATTIAVRILGWAGEPTSDAIVRHRLRNALEWRNRIVPSDTNCYRLVNGEGDGLPGVVIDRYGDVMVVQILTAGADRMRGEITAALSEMLAPRAIVERSQGAVRKHEGLDDRVGIIAGEAVARTIVCENGIKLEVDLELGQKTGCFLDQRENRARIKGLAKDARVLDLCCYAGGFSLAAMAGGAREIVAVDTSARALEWARRNCALNGFDAAPIQFVHAEAGKFLAQSDRRFDLVILDPPPLARSRADAPRAANLYSALNALALEAVAPGGYLMTFSCSAHFRGEDFVHALRIAQVKSHRRMRLVARLGPAADHPAMLGHAEGEYLTGLLLHNPG